MAILKDDTSYTHVIAIDFGTGASGYGIAPMLVEAGQKPRIEVFNPCDDLDDQKTSTAILFDDEGNFLAFGTHALQRYAEILDDEESALLFQSYKMHLLHMDENAVSLDARELPLMKVISESLKYIADKAVEKLTEQIGKVINSKIRWVLTVPALWGEDHKQFMRKAAMNAGIIDSLNSPNLLLSLEPEGASIQCREDAEENIRNSLDKDKIVMVLDCGGGTVDITVHKLMCEPEENFLCEEFLPSSGGCEWGSKYVDAHFEKFLEKLFGEELYADYRRNALARLEILKHFEMLKRKFNPGKEERSRLQLSYLGDDLSSSRLKELIEEWNSNIPDPLIQLKKRGASGIDIPPTLMKSFFEPLFEKITEKVNELMQESVSSKGEEINFIFMVGGFSESPYLKAVIKETFEREDLHILVPRRPQVSVIRGACLFGINPRSITSRISKKTYGINTLTTFDPEKHPEEKKVIIEGEEF
mmetsp:Transcript_18256/g.17949  ORF Transcript_18256/g.17949 Transcript_18256/m.17949 type:complete len:474 (+) Transcript_18256:22-1443(+)|eukprot:CAMPEP_0197006854 /NCGR_PEP_ID=MMETSP1380-20130617/37522_1 /TAXON_ID=5936 /ORGANISM="Euplotes crassus, Strain CT5" /LENGTH=473 /DNA_ID=CAMNT_0042426669 /DNA_START=13 /DNA_END=1434 /DNA_ORIENTATION=+